MKILIASDHAGFDLKEKIKQKFSKDYEFIDLGTNSADSVDYPDFAEKLAKELIKGTAKEGILICGSGIGISIKANRYKEVRAALCYTEEAAKLSRQHNDANVLVLGARTVAEDINLKSVKTFFSTEFEGGRHQKRVDKLGC